MPSEMVKEPIIYSIYCSEMNNNPNTIVIAKPNRASIDCPCAIAIWVHVIVTPLESRIEVLSRGTLKGLGAHTPKGGQIEPISIPGLREEWKKHQKNEKNRNISLIMNNNIPRRNPISTFVVCLPWSVASRLTSRHQRIMVRIRAPIPIFKRWLSTLWMYPTEPDNRKRAPAEPVNGQGLGSTRWYGCFILLFHKKLFCKNSSNCWKHNVINTYQLKVDCQRL